MKRYITLVFSPEKRDRFLQKWHSWSVLQQNFRELLEQKVRKTRGKIHMHTTERKETDCL